MKNVIHPESAFGPDFKFSIDWAEFGAGSQRSAKATERREAQLARGNTGTIFGLSQKSDEEIGYRGRLSKNSRLG